MLCIKNHLSLYVIDRTHRWFFPQIWLLTCGGAGFILIYYFLLLLNTPVTQGAINEKKSPSVNFRAARRNHMGRGFLRAERLRAVSRPAHDNGAAFAHRVFGAVRRLPAAPKV